MGFTFLDHLDRATLGYAAGAERCIIGIGYGARSDDGASDETAGAGGVGDKLVKAERHFAAMGISGPSAVDMYLQRQMDAAVPPCLAQFIGRDRKGRD